MTIANRAAKVIITVSFLLNLLNMAFTVERTPITEDSEEYPNVLTQRSIPVISSCAILPCLASPRTKPLRKPNRKECGRLWAIPYYGPGNIILGQLTILYLADLLKCKPGVVLFDIACHYLDESINATNIATLEQLYNPSSYGQASLGLEQPIQDIILIERTNIVRKKDRRIGKLKQLMPVLRQRSMLSEYFTYNDTVPLTEQFELATGPDHEIFKLGWNLCSLAPLGSNTCAEKESSWLRSELFGDESPFRLIDDIHPTPPHFIMSAQIRVNDELWRRDDTMDKEFNATDLLRGGIRTSVPPIALRGLLRLLVETSEPGPIYLTAPPVWHFWEAVDEINHEALSNSGRILVYNVSSFHSSSPEMLLDHQLLASAATFVYDAGSTYSTAAMVRRYGTNGTISMKEFISDLHRLNL